MRHECMKDVSTVCKRRDNCLVCKKLRYRSVNEPVVQYNGTDTGHIQD